MLHTTVPLRNSITVQPIMGGAIRFVGIVGVGYLSDIVRNHRIRHL